MDAAQTMLSRLLVCLVCILHAQYPCWLGSHVNNSRQMVGSPGNAKAWRGEMLCPPAGSAAHYYAGLFAIPIRAAQILVLFCMCFMTGFQIPALYVGLLGSRMALWAAHSLGFAFGHRTKLVLVVPCYQLTPAPFAPNASGSGILGLQNLLYLANTHPRHFQVLLHKINGTRAAWEYPFACAGTNLTFMLAEALELKPDNRAR